ncbi:MAG: hypothetical protein EP348_02300 [Alphaproteobacteria bacterium]|nr:MAG: hypothetical protein EP348_02300 [Alphaproteobacteria bacterium]
MLHAMRKGASSWLAKGLLLLLVASFAIWGIGASMLNSSVGNNAIEVGNQTISLPEFQRAYQRNLNILSQRLQTRLTEEQARQYHLAQLTVNQLASRAVMDQKTKSLGLSASDDDIRDVIHQQKTFQNQTNKFDRFQFEQFLRASGYSEGEYIHMVRNDIMGRQLMDSISNGVTNGPKVMADAIYAYFAEERTANYINIRDTAAGDAPMPEEKELKEFISKNTAAYSAPEYRQVNYLLFKPEDFVKDDPVTDDDLKSEYESRISEFSEPEERQVQQMIFDSEAKARSAREKLEKGEDFTNVGKSDLKLTAEDMDLGKVTRQELLPALQKPVFDLAKGGITEPIKTSLGWHILKVIDIKPEKVKSMSEVKDKLVHDIHLRAAGDVMYKQATKTEDEFAGGATLGEAAKTLNLTVKTAWLDAHGMDKDGKAVEDLPNDPDFLKSVFTKEKGAEPEITEMQNGNYFAVVVTDIQPSALRPMADIQDEATKSWQENWRHEQIKKKANDLINELKDGKSLANIAKEQGVEVETSKPLKRNGQSTELSAAARSGLFGLKKGEYGAAENATQNGMLIFEVDSVIPADPTKDKATADKVSDWVANSIRTSIVAEYESYLQKEIGISVKERLLREYY